MVKLVAIDIDGTLLNSAGVLTDAVKNTLKKASEKGVKVVLATGRPLKGVEALLKELDLVGGDQYVITYNGSLVQTTDGTKVIKEYGLSLETFNEVNALANDYDVSFYAADRSYLYTTQRDIGIYVAYESNLVKMPIRVRTLEEVQNSQLSIQKMMFADDPQKIDDVVAKLPEWFTQKYFTVKSTPFYLEILHKEANKGNALKALCEHLNIPLSDVMAIGDNHNDMDMIVIAGESVAMGNAVEAIKLAAKHQTTSHNEDGVAHIVSKIVLGD
ncbi:sugar-phosphatase [Carnobacteriaceae bacterium zg-C25]|nr:sugar-phosphatase [Carnobacteriaceae bacterium zg-C25]